jgi:hypothetical protein
VFFGHAGYTEGRKVIGGIFLACRLLIWVFDPTVVNCIEVFDQGLFDSIEFHEGQFALIELTVEKFFHCDLVDERLNA